MKYILLFLQCIRCTRYIWSRNSTKSWTRWVIQWCLEVLWQLRESCFQKQMAWWRLLVQRMCKNFHLLENALKAHVQHVSSC